MIKGITEDILKKVYSFTEMTDEELRCKFFQKLQECIELCNNSSEILDWLKNEGLEKEVNELLTQWKDDGTLDKLINIDLFNDLKSELIDKISNINSQLDKMTQKTISNIVMKMVNGENVIIDCRGDSTFYGHDPLSSSGSKVATPPPLKLQEVLRSYYNNNNIIVINNGVKGHSTKNAITNWETWMTCSSDVVILNYCINDQDGTNKITGEDYRNNLRYLVTKAREKNKVVILQTPNECTKGGQYGSIIRAEGVKQYSEIMRQVAFELNVPLIDVFEMTNKYFQHGNYISSIVGDGYHPTQELYISIGEYMVKPFILTNISSIKDKSIIPATTSSIYGYGGSVSVTKSNNNSIVDEGFFAQHLKIPFIVDEEGLDIFISTPIWNTASSNITVKIDGSIIGYLNLNDTNYATGKFAVDNEIMVLKNAKQGLHIIELDSNDGNDVGLYYIKALKTTDHLDNIGDIQINDKKIEFYNLKINISNSSNMSNILLNRTLSNLIDVIEVDIKSQFNKNTGFGLFGHKSKGYVNTFGLLMFLDNNGYLSVAENKGSSYTNITKIGVVDLSTSSHKYTIKVDKNNLGTFIVDDVTIGTYQMTKDVKGGQIGIYCGGDCDLVIETICI